MIASQVIKKRRLRIEPLEERRLLDAVPLLAHWPMDDGAYSGTTIDDVAGHAEGPFDGIAQNGGPIMGQTGLLDEAALFEGGASNGYWHYIDLLPHVSTFASMGTATLSAWIQPSTTGLATSVLTIFAASDSTAESTEVRLFISNGGTLGIGTLVYGVRNNGTTLGNVVASGVNLLDGQWHHVACTIADDDSVSLYVDGELEASGSAPFVDGLSVVNAAALGRNRDSTTGGGQWYFDGLMDDVGLWTDALSAIEVRAVHELADDSTLRLDLGEAQSLLEAFDAQSETVEVGGLQWHYVASGLLGDEGELVGGGGSYSLNLGGGSGLYAGAVPLVVIDITPADGAILAGSVDSITVDFSASVDAASLDASDLTIDTIPADACTLIDADTVQFDWNETFGVGDHQVAIAAGAIESIDGGPVLAHASGFIVLGISETAAPLLAHWSMDDGTYSGTTIGDTAGSADGPFDGVGQNGGPVMGETGLLGEAARFDGGANNGYWHYVDLSTHVSILGQVGEGTLSAWIKPDTDLETDVLTIFAASDASVGSTEMRLFVSNGGTFGAGTLVYGVRNDATSVGSVVTTGVNLLDGQWHHIALTVDANDSVWLYIDGNSLGNGSAPFLDGVPGINAIALGRNIDTTVGGGQWFFDGLMDDVGLWSDILSPAEVRAVFNLAQESSLQFDLSQAQSLFELYHEGDGNVEVGGLTWYYISSDLTGDEGELVDLGDGYYSLNLGGGSGLRTGEAPLMVLGTTPADDAVLDAPIDSITVDFSMPVEPTSIQAADLAIDTIPADSFTLIDADTIQFHWTVPFDVGQHQVRIAAGALENTEAEPVQPYSGWFVVVGAPDIIAMSAEGIGPNVATLRGEMLDTGGDQVTIDLCWGTGDGGETPENWQNVLTWTTSTAETIAEQVTGLELGTTYYYRFRATNAVGSDWSSPAQGFTTSTAYPEILLTEFMAANDSTLTDQFGQYSDWIEILNAGDEPVDLAGWSLTDDASQPTQWSFPTYVIKPGEYLVVFASGRDLIDPTEPLHTNFKLDADGEYLALVEPDGTTIAGRFELDGTDYPDQWPDVSYGLPQETVATTLVAADADALFLVPTDDSLGDSWIDAGFNDNAWTTVTLPVGYQTEVFADGLLGFWDFADDADPGGTVPDVSGAATTNDGTLVGDAYTADDTLHLDGTGDYVDLGDPSTIEGLSAMTISAWVYVDTAFTDLRRIAEHEDVFYFWAEGGYFRFTVHGSSGTATGTTAIVADRWYHVAATTDGTTGKLYVNGQLEATCSLAAMPVSSYPMQLGARRSGGGTATNFWPGQLDDIGIWSRVLSAEEIAALASYESQAPAFTTDVESMMYDENASAYLRRTFTVTDPDQFERLELNITYDDGFVAYLNGVEVARRGVDDGSVAWNGTAQYDLQTSITATIDLTEWLGLLTSGENVLAIHGLNFSADGNDFFLSPELVAYNVDTVQPLQARFFYEPTPGEPNNLGVIGFVTEEVAFSQSAGSFTGTFNLTLSCDNPAAEIRYTLDGSIPTESSLLYTGPITIDETTQVFARVVLTDWHPGPVTTAAYIHLATDVLSFDSSLPIIVIENFGAGDIPNKREGVSAAGDGSGIVQVAFQAAWMTIFDTVEGTSTLTTDPQLASRIGIRVRGSSTANLVDQSYTVETWDAYDQDADVSPLGLPAESDWVLYTPTSYDASLIHNSFMYELSNQMGDYAVRTRFVEVFINTDGGSVTMDDFAGFYILMEKIKRSDVRVDFEALSEDATSGGWMITCDRMDPIPIGGEGTPQYFHTAGPNRIQETPANTPGVGDDIPLSYNTFFNFDDPGGYEINAVQRQTIEDWFREFEDVLYGDDFADPLVGYAAYIDVPSLIDHFILNNLSLNRDGLQLSTWMYKPSADDKLYFGPIWDFDRAFTNFSATSSLDWCTDFLWMPRLFEDPNFVQEYIDRWQELRQDGNVLSLENLYSNINDQAAQITTEVAARNGTSSWTTKLTAMKNWIATRFAALDAQFVSMPELSSDGGTVPAGYTVGVVPAAASTYYTLDGSDPRAPGGGVAPGALLLDDSMHITINQNANLTVRTLDGGEWSGPARAVFLVEGPLPLAITEINYHPQDPSPAEIAAGFDDNDLFEYVELQNIGTVAIDLTGIRFVAGIEFDFTGGAVTSLQPGEFVLVVKDQAAFQMRYGSGLPVAGEFASETGLSNGGETLTLNDALDIPIIEFTFDDSGDWPGRADGNGSTLEVVDTGGDYNDPANWRSSSEYGGTPAAAGIGARDDIVINELRANSGTLSGGDWFELYNTTDQPIDIGGWWMSDSGDDYAKFVVPDGTIVPGHGYLVIYEDQFNPAVPAPGQTPFGLGADGDDLWLLETDALGNPISFVDHVEFGPGETGQTVGRLPNATGAVVSLTGPTPGLANETIVVSGRHLFYAGSVLGQTIAPDKTALLPEETASAANWSNYQHGITGVAIDISILDVGAALDVADFDFLLGNDGDPGGWTALTTAPTILVEQDAGLYGSDRIWLTWADDTIVDAWLRVTVKANADTGLLREGIFYFGHATGDVGDPASPGFVTAADLVAIRNHPHGAANPAAIDNRYDINRDTLVDATDLILARNSTGSPLDALRMITPPSVPAPVPAPSDIPGDASGQPPAAVGFDTWETAFSKRAAAGETADPLLIDLLLAGG